MKNALTGLLILTVAVALPRFASSIRNSPSPQDLPNDCALVATEANARMQGAGVWSRILIFTHIDLGRGCLVGHAVTVFQPAEGSHILVYDGGGTVELDTDSHDLSEVIKGLSHVEHLLVVESHFVTPEKP